jgi:hypothetical protein
MKNLDFRVRPDGRDIFIEVTTPRMSLETGLMYSDTPHAGFFDPGRGIEREGYAGPSRAEIVVENKVINQILEATSGTDYPVVLIINCTYAYPEIMMGFGEDVSGRISGIIHYRNGTSEFRSALRCNLPEKAVLHAPDGTDPGPGGCSRYSPGKMRSGGNLLVRRSFNKLQKFLTKGRYSQVDIGFCPSTV